MIWEAAFKRRSSGKLLWLTCNAATNSEAIKKLTKRVYPLKYNLYGGPFVNSTPVTETVAGAICAVVGPNGAGKSTLLNALTGHPSLKVDGSTEEFIKPFFLAFQKPPSIDELTYEQLIIVLDKLHNDFLGTSEQVKERYKEVIDELAITDEMFLAKIGSTLSGGELKKMELLQLFIIKPKTVFLDEIDTGMDIDTKLVTGKLINLYLKGSGATALIVSHSLDYFEYFDINKVLLIKNGIGKMYPKSVIKQIKQEGFKSF